MASDTSTPTSGSGRYGDVQPFRPVRFDDAFDGAGFEEIPFQFSNFYIIFNDQDAFHDRPPLFVAR